MATLDYRTTCELNKPVTIKHLDGMFFSQDVQANRIVVSVVRGGVNENLSGTVSANIIRADGSTVAQAGTISGNIASVTMPAAAYAVPGAIAVFVKHTQSGVTSTIAAVTGYVYKSTTDTIVDPGTIIPSVQNLIEAIEDAVATIPQDYQDLEDSVSELGDEIDEISEEYSSSEETVEVEVELDLSDIREGKRTVDVVGASMNINDSTVTTAIIRPFLCEANKTYRLTITNGATPASITDRGTVVITNPVTSGGVVTWVKRTTNTANAQDVVEFTPDVSGYVYFNLDKNYQSISVVEIETHTTTELTAVDKSARDSIDTVIEDVKTGQETVPVTIDTTNEVIGRRLPDVAGATFKKDGSNLNTSSATNVLLGVFECVSGKEYTLTVVNGETPALVAERSVIAIVHDYSDTYYKIDQVYRLTNSANATDEFVFTPSYSGTVCLGLDANYQSISITEEVDVFEKSAIDLTARDAIDALETRAESIEENVEDLDESVGELSETVQSFEEAAEKINDVTEKYYDGSTLEPVSIDLSGIREGQRCMDVVGHQMNYSSSSVTTCIPYAFKCEANKTYRLTITNGSTPASIADRGTVVVATGTTNKTCAWVKRSTNTSNETDGVEFVPTVSGDVFFNVDKNFQSISVVEVVQVEKTTAIDSKTRNVAFGNKIEKEITWESGSFGKTLANESGNGYRTNIITGVKGCALCIKVDPSYSFVYGDGVNDLMTIYGIYVIHPKADTIRIGLSDTAENVGFEMRIYKERGHKGRYDVIVAASDSTEEDKAIADIVCDGENDELDLQFAVNWNFFRRVRTLYADKCNVLLMPGTYNIDSFSQQYASNGQLMRNAYAVCMGNEPYNGYAFYKYRMSIEGCYTTENAQGESSVLIKVTNDGIQALSEDVDNAIFGLALSSEGTTGSFHLNSMSICVSNLCIYANGYQNKVIGIDAYQAGNAYIKDVSVYTCTDPYIPDSYIQLTPVGSIGIRAGCGSCAGVRQRIEGCRTQGFHEGIAICGEHFIIQDNLEVGCYYGFTTNNYPVGGAVQHPNVFIGNSVEQCHCMGKFGESGNRSTIVYIGGSVENKITSGSEPVLMLPIEIAENTRNRGRIESDSLASPYNESMFEAGRGGTFEQTIYPYTQA